MVDFITSGEKTPNAVGGLYFNRHKEYPRFIGGNFSEPILQTQDISSLDSLTSPIKVDFTGTGMLLFWKNTCPKYFSFQVKGLGWHDWAWCYDLKILGGDLFILPEVYCKHYTDKDNYVRPDLNNYLSSEEIEPKIIFKDMEELMVLGTGKKLQNSVNKLLKSGWHIKEMNPRKQPIFSSNDVENIEEVMKAISDSKPVELKLKSGTSIQNACLNYETIEVILTKE